MARRHREVTIHAGDLAAHPDGEGADTVTLVIHVAADGAAGASLGAELARRRDAVAAEESHYSGRRYRRGKERGGNEGRPLCGATQVAAVQMSVARLSAATINPDARPDLKDDVCVNRISRFG